MESVQPLIDTYFTLYSATLKAMDNHDHSLAASYLRDLQHLRDKINRLIARDVDAVARQLEHLEKHTVRIATSNGTLYSMWSYDPSLDTYVLRFTAPSIPDVTVSSGHE